MRSAQAMLPAMRHATPAPCHEPSGGAGRRLACRGPGPAPRASPNSPPLHPKPAPPVVHQAARLWRRAQGDRGHPGRGGIRRRVIRPSAGARRGGWRARRPSIGLNGDLAGGGRGRPALHIAGGAGLVVPTSPRPPSHPKQVRLAWHSAGTYDKATGTGGSNGATMRFAPESEHGANAGLAVARWGAESPRAQAAGRQPKRGGACHATRACCVGLLLKRASTPQPLEHAPQPAPLVPPPCWPGPCWSPSRPRWGAGAGVPGRGACGWASWTGAAAGWRGMAAARNARLGSLAPAVRPREPPCALTAPLPIPFWDPPVPVDQLRRPLHTGGRHRHRGHGR